MILYTKMWDSLSEVSLDSIYASLAQLDDEIPVPFVRFRIGEVYKGL
jgi:hypothetical protein